MATLNQVKVNEMVQALERAAKLAAELSTTKRESLTESEDKFTFIRLQRIIHVYMETAKGKSMTPDAAVARFNSDKGQVSATNSKA